MGFKELAHCEVGEIKCLATCDGCEKIVRLFVNGTAIEMRAHRFKRERCTCKPTAFTNRMYTLQQRVRITKKGARDIKLIWVRI